MTKPNPTELELGKMTPHELYEACVERDKRRRTAVGCNCPYATEWKKRSEHHRLGLLTPAQVRAKLEPLLINGQRLRNNVLHIAARALLGLPEDAPSPLKEPTDD